MSKLNKKYINVFLLIVATVVVLYMSLKNNFFEVVNGFSRLNLFFLVIAFGLVFCFYCLRGVSLYIFVKEFKCDVCFFDVLKLVFVTQFFDGITPSSSGGQPYQIYALKRDGLSLVDATNVTIQNFIVYQIALVLLGLIAVIFNSYLDLFCDVGVIKNLIIFGFIINVLVVVVLFSLAFLKKFNKVVLSFCVKVLARFRIIKNYERVLNDINEYINKFHAGAMMLLKNKAMFIRTIFFNFVALLVFYMVPAVLIYGLGFYNLIDIFSSIITSAYVMLIGSFMPIPGGTGGLEYAFIQFYGVFISGSDLTLVMLLWRFLTYYIGVVIGAVLFNIGKK